MISSSRLLGTTLPAIVLAIVFAAGCGSKGQQGTVRTGAGTVTAETGLPLNPSSLTKAQFLVRANRLCRESWAAMRKEFSQFRAERGSGMSDAQLFAYSARNNFLTHIQFWFDDISYLGAPTGVKSETESMMQILQPEDTLKALELAVFSGQERRVSDAKQLGAIFSSYDRLARKYGLDDCLVEETSFE